MSSHDFCSHARLQAGLILIKGVKGEKRKAMVWLNSALKTELACQTLHHCTRSLIGCSFLDTIVPALSSYCVMQKWWSVSCYCKFSSHAAVPALALIVTCQLSRSDGFIFY